MSESNLLADGRWQGRILSEEWLCADRSHDVTAPATQQVLGKVGQASAAQVSHAAAGAARAQAEWATQPAAMRARVLRRAAEIFEHEATAIAGWLVRESGSTWAKARGEVAACAAHAIEAAALCTQPPGLVMPDSGTSRYGLSIAQRRPRGVVGIIAPFNYPLILAFRSVAPALALGNAVVLKPDLQTAVSGGVVIARVLEEAGLPSGLIHMLPGGADVGQAMCTDPRIPMIVFVGSTSVGRQVGELCGRHLKKVTLELGGKNAAIVLNDADLELAASNVAFGCFTHGGQICMATGRVLVDRSIAVPFLELLAAKANTICLGDPFTEEGVTMGPLINAKQAGSVEAVVADALARGARLHAGGHRNGNFYAPTVLSDVRAGMRAFDDEIFGPVACISTFDGDDEAVALASQTDYGLTASILSGSSSRALTLGQRLSVGMLHINGPTVGNDVCAPFGGCGASGNGSRQGGPANWDEFTEWQWTTVQETPRRFL